STAQRAPPAPGCEPLPRTVVAPPGRDLPVLPPAPRLPPGGPSFLPPGQGDPPFRDPPRGVRHRRVALPRLAQERLDLDALGLQVRPVRFEDGRELRGAHLDVELHAEGRPTQPE